KPTSQNMKTRFLAVSFALIFVFPFVSAAFSAEPITDVVFRERVKSVQEAVNTLHRIGTFPGVAVGFVLADGRSAVCSAGFADVENKIRLKPSDRFLA